ncbi:MAG: glycosyl transferase family 4 [Nanoarchaeota archaeon]|nr:glycosyl transferase family 4 [Nanoarchaeota archaeon]
MDNLTFLGFLFGPLLMLSFLITIFVVPIWIRRAKAENMVGRDIHKKGKPKVAEGGGIVVLIGFVVSIMAYIGIRTFIFQDQTHLIEIFGLLGVLLLASIVGIFDDLLGWKRGLSQRARLVLIFFSAVPLMVLGAGDFSILGYQIGILYPLILIPLGIIGATTTFNFLAGYNGLETSQGIILLSGLTIVTFITGNWWLSLISACMIAALIAFYFFNKYPAKVFPGDILTYSVGALIACIAILGNIELIALFFFIPYLLEILLKLRGKLKKQSFGKLEKDGSLSIKEGIYGLEHLAIWFLKKIKGKAYEWEVPIVINVFQILVIVLGLIWFF